MFAFADVSTSAVSVVLSVAKYDQYWVSYCFVWFDTSFDCNLFYFRQVIEKCHPFSSVLFWYGIVPIQFYFMRLQFSRKYFSSYRVRTGRSKRVVYTVHLRQNHTFGQYVWSATDGLKICRSRVLLSACRFYLWGKT